MKLNLIPLYLVVIALTFFSCQREIDLPPGSNPVPELPDTTTVEPPPELPPVSLGNQVVTSVHGKVTDENGNALPGVLVRAGNKTGVTNEYGIFRITDVVVPEKYTFIRAEKNGYFNGSRTIVSTPSRNGFVKIQLMRKELKGAFSASDGVSLDINANSSVHMQPGAIVTNSGVAYNGKVSVYAAEISPASADFNETMPGDLRAINADSQFVALKSYGMLTVELESESGEPLQLAPGKPATIKMKVPASLASSAPQQIPLWHFSDSDGLWREEGKAHLENGWYSGTVSHFSTWNYDVQSDFVFVTLLVRGMKGGARPYSRVKIVDTNGGYSLTYTDSSGYLRTWVPKNVPLEVQVLNECGGILYSQQASPKSEDSDLGIAYVGFGQTSLVTGTVLDCNSQPATSGYATLFYGGLNHTTEIIDGQFYFYLDKCETGNYYAEFYVTDAESHYYSPTQNVTLSGQDQDLGEFSNCDLKLNEYVYYKIGSDSILAQGASSYITYTGFVNGDSLTRITFTHRLMDVGAYDITVQFRDSTVHTSTIYNPTNVMLYLVTYTPVSPLTVNVKKYGAIGEEVFLTFSGTYKNTETQQVVPLVGEMRVIRQQ